MWNLLKDYSIWIIGALISLWEIINSIKKNKKIKQSKIIFFSALALLFLILGIDQINRQEKDKRNQKNESVLNKNKLDSLKDLLTKLNTERNNEHKKDSEFLNSLFLEFKIIKDSSNKPKKSTFYTNIGIAHTVNIGN